MQELADRKAVEFQEQFLNQQLDVLFEIENQKDSAIIDGLTGNYIRVYVNGNKNMQGKIYKVLLIKTYQDGLWGEIVQ